MCPSSVNTLELLGLSGAELSLYRTLRPHSGRTVAELAGSLEVSGEEFLDLVATLRSSGVLREDNGVVTIPSPTQLLSEVISVEADQLRASVERLERVRTSIPAVRGLLDDPVTDQTLSGVELRVGGNIHEVLQGWVRESTGDLMWVRPDQWMLPYDAGMARVVRAALERGQRSRAIYPARVLDEAPSTIFDRMASGEEVRLLAEVPSRMAIVANVGALVPEHWGESNDRRIVIQQPGLAAVLAELFDEMWVRAVVVPGPLPVDLDRRLLLEQLSRGAKDEQIARTLGLSLRTVRRRVAALLSDLGAETRFGAGVEAVRRGWI